MTGKKLTPEEVARAKVAAEQQARAWAVFLEYHENSPWAEAKAAAGGWLSLEVIGYMEREVAARKHAAAEYDKKVTAEKEQLNASAPTPSKVAGEPLGSVAGDAGGGGGGSETPG